MGVDSDLIQYQAIVVPWLWFLTRTSDCRIFQEMTVPDIIKQVFREHEFTDFDEFVEKQGLSGKVSDLNTETKHKRSRPNIKTFEDLYMDYKTKIDEKDLEDEY